MKLFLLFMLINLTSFGQVNDTTLTGIQLDDKVIFLQVLKDFKTEARKQGIYIDHFISQDLGGIVYLTEEEISKVDQRKGDVNTPAGITYRVNSFDIMGFWHRTPMIGIHEDMKHRGYKLIKLIIYHELGHFFGLDHLNDIEYSKFGMHIMCPVLTNKYLENDIGEIAMKDYWERLKNVNGRKRWRRDSNNN